MNLGSKIVLGVAVLAVIAAAAGGYYFYHKYQTTQKELQTIKTDPSTVQKAAQDEVNKLVAQVGKLIDLPGNEQPTVATITDISKLKDQPFFQNAKNGDKVLIYTNAKKAILYDPNQNKVIDVAPVNIGSASAQQAAPEAKIDIRNGTATPGLASKVEADLIKSMPNANVINKDNSSKTSYEKTVVVALNDQAKDAATNIAKLLGATVAGLPDGENKPANADIMIIIGKDKIEASTPAPTSGAKP